MKEQVYFICTTPRSGSNLLCDLLESSEMMGKPSEYLNITGTIPTLANKHNLIDINSTIVFEKYIDFVINKTSSANNVCGIKIFYNQLEKFIDFPRMKNILQQSQFIFLTRKDLVAQAVSMYIAMETGYWKSTKEDKNSRNLVEYNEKKINKILGDLLQQKIKWTEFFEINKINYLEVSYEKILENPNQYCQDICKFCNVNIPNHHFSTVTSRYKKQGDTINEQFTNNFYKNYKLNLEKQINSHKLDIHNFKIV